MELVFFKQLEASYFLQAPTSDFGVAKIKWRVIIDFKFCCLWIPLTLLV
jgi:hypothetical protein